MRLGDGPDEGVHAVWGDVGWALGSPGAHLVFEVGEGADVVDFALFVECCDRLGGGAYLPRLAFTDTYLKGLAAGCGAQHLFDKVSAVVDLSYDAVGAVLVVEGYGALGPTVGGHAARAVG